MNKLPILILALILGLNSYAQTATSQEGYITDPDGYTNVREAQSGNAHIVTTIETGELFKFQISDKSDWWQVTTNDGTTGYVHNSRIVSVSTKTNEIIKLISDIRTTDLNNVEFGEVSNEQLFIFAEKFPKSFVNAFDIASAQTQELIIKELETPIHDGIDLKLVYQRIKGTDLKTSSTSKILEAVKVAGNKMSLDITK